MATITTTECRMISGGLGSDLLHHHVCFLNECLLPCQHDHENEKLKYGSNILGIFVLYKSLEYCMYGIYFYIQVDVGYGSKVIYLNGPNFSANYKSKLNLIPIHS